MCFVSVERVDGPKKLVHYIVTYREIALITATDKYFPTSHQFFYVNVILQRILLQNVRRRFVLKINEILS